MCWQCTTPPWRYLPGAKLYGNPVKGPVVVEWEGFWLVDEMAADWGYDPEPLPGDTDPEGVPYFKKVDALYITEHQLVFGEEVRSSTGWRWSPKEIETI